MSFRILHCIASVNPVGGGPIEGVKQLSAVNRRQGHTIEVVSLDDPASPWVRDCPIKCHAMGPGRLAYGYSPKLVSWLRAHRSDYDVVIVNGLWQFHSFGAWLALRGSPTPYFVYPHGMLDPWFKRTYPLKHLKKWLYWPWAEYRLLRDATAVLFTCEDERRLARQSFWLYKCDEYVVNYGTSAPPAQADAQRQAFLARFPHLAGKRCLLFLGRVHVKKGPDLLLNSFASLLKRLTPDEARDLHIVMAGPSDDAYGHAMKSLAQSLALEDRITWTGMVSGDVKWGAFRCADAFILPSHQENFGIAVAEALACGVPVLISNQVNIWREVQQAGAGFVDSDDLAGTGRLLDTWVAARPTEWAHVRDNAVKCFNRRFLIDRSAESFIQAMEIYGLRPNVPKLSPI
ncbi:MAG: glycosyltransferase [Burkholderiales bacterium]|nr:glycosyltransferase [Burkholderiales bacterium]